MTTQKLKVTLLLLSLTLVILSLIMSIPEIQFRLDGKITNATITGERPLNHGTDFVVLEFVYMDGNTPRRGTATVPLSPTRLYASFNISYVPGKDLSRLPGDFHNTWPIIFGPSTLFLLASLTWILFSRQKSGD